jgi:hypothetical protein
VEPYPILQGLVDSRMAGGSSGAGMKRRRGMNVRPTSRFLFSSQSPDMCVQCMYMSMVDTYDMYVFANTVRVRMVTPHHSSGGDDESDGGHSGIDGDEDVM